MLKFILLLTALLISYSLADTHTPNGELCTITSVIDGDTVHADCNQRHTKIRLTVIDSYEKSRNNRAFKQAYQRNMNIEEVVARGKRAKTITTTLLLGKRITFVADSNEPKDRYGRDLGKIYLNNEEVNKKLLTEHPDEFLKY